MSHDVIPEAVLNLAEDGPTCRRFKVLENLAYVVGASSSLHNGLLGRECRLDGRSDVFSPIRPK
eukprot:2680641-Lingulodinium_polyedra.AAC.1